MDPEKSHMIVCLLRPSAEAGYTWVMEKRGQTHSFAPHPSPAMPFSIVCVDPGTSEAQAKKLKQE